MIKPIQIRSHSFAQISRGAYKASDVDEYLTEVASQLEEHLQEREQLVKKITMLADKVQEYRDDEDSIGAALLNAQKMAAKLTREAEENANELNAKAEQQAKELEERAIEKARDIISAANDKGEQLVADAQKQHDAIVNATDKDARAQLEATKKELAMVKDELNSVKAIVTSLKTKALETYYAHISDIKEISSLVEEKYAETETLNNEIDAVIAEEASVVEEAPEVVEVTQEEVVEDVVAADEPRNAETVEETAEVAEEIAVEVVEENSEEATQAEPDFSAFKVNLENLTDGGNSDFFSFFTNKDEE